MLHRGTPTWDERLIHLMLVLSTVSNVFGFCVYMSLPDNILPAKTALSWPFSGLVNPCIKPPPDRKVPVRFCGPGRGPEKVVPDFNVSTPSC